MTLDNPVTMIVVVLLLLLLAGAGAVASVSIIFAYVPEARAWAKEQIDRLRRRR